MIFDRQRARKAWGVRFAWSPVSHNAGRGLPGNMLALHPIRSRRHTIQFGPGQRRELEVTSTRTVRSVSLVAVELEQQGRDAIARPPELQLREFVHCLG